MTRNCLLDWLIVCLRGSKEHAMTIFLKLFSAGFPMSRTRIRPFFRHKCSWERSWGRTPFPGSKEHLNFISPKMQRWATPTPIQLRATERFKGKSDKCTVRERNRERKDRKHSENQLWSIEVESFRNCSISLTLISPFPINYCQLEYYNEFFIHRIKNWSSTFIIQRRNKDIWK